MEAGQPKQRRCLYFRPRGGSRLKEFRAIGPIDAPTSAVHAVINDFELFKLHALYTGVPALKRESDSIITYQRLSPKICEDRDYTCAFESWPGRGLTYLDQWKPANDLAPEKNGVVSKDLRRRMAARGRRRNQNTRLTPFTDTGGMIPAFIANCASGRIHKLFEAVANGSKIKVRHVCKKRAADFPPVHEGDRFLF
jgi:hypothetical protein